jgi:hypothetical protein
MRNRDVRESLDDFGRSIRLRLGSRTEDVGSGCGGLGAGEGTSLQSQRQREVDQHLIGKERRSIMQKQLKQ